MQGVFLIESNKILVQGCEHVKFEIDWNRETIAFSGDFRIGKSEREEILEGEQQKQIEKAPKKRKRIKKNISQIKEEIIRFLKDKGGKGTFYYSSHPRCSLKAREETSAIGKSISSDKTSVRKGLFELLSEEKLTKTSQGRGGAFVYTINNNGKLKENIIEPEEKIPEKIHTEEKKIKLSDAIKNSPGNPPKPQKFLSPEFKPFNPGDYDYAALKEAMVCPKCQNKLALSDLKATGSWETHLYSQDDRECLQCLICGAEYYKRGEEAVQCQNPVR